MSEEKIIKKCEDYENWKEFYNPNGIYQAIPLSKEHKQAIQGLLELYKQEKEKNKKIEDKIKEKIEEYRYLMQNPKEAEHYVAWYSRRIEILEELLKGE